MYYVLQRNYRNSEPPFFSNSILWHPNKIWECASVSSWEEKIRNKHYGENFLRKQLRREMCRKMNYPFVCKHNAFSLCRAMGIQRSIYKLINWLLCGRRRVIDSITKTLLWPVCFIEKKFSLISSLQSVMGTSVLPRLLPVSIWTIPSGNSICFHAVTFPRVSFSGPRPLKFNQA